MQKVDSHRLILAAFFNAYRCFIASWCVVTFFYQYYIDLVWTGT
jgi:hypothetical protein